MVPLLWSAHPSLKFICSWTLGTRPKYLKYSMVFRTQAHSSYSYFIFHISAETHLYELFFGLKNHPSLRHMIASSTILVRWHILPNWLSNKKMEKNSYIVSFPGDSVNWYRLPELWPSGCIREVLIHDRVHASHIRECTHQCPVVICAPNVNL